MTIPPERKRIVVNANVYPEGFFVNSNNKIYITKISPFYRLREIKNRPKTINWILCLMTSPMIHQIALVMAF